MSHNGMQDTWTRVHITDQVSYVYVFIKKKKVSYVYVVETGYIFTNLYYMRCLFGTCRLLKGERFG